MPMTTIPGYKSPGYKSPGLLAVLLASLFWLTGFSHAEEPTDFNTLVNSLADAGFEEKSQIARNIAGSSHASSERVLDAFASGNLCRQKSDNRMAIISSETADGLQLQDAVSGDAIGTVGKRDVSRITVNNRLRGELKMLVAQFQLQHTDAKVRSKAARRLLQEPDAGLLPALDAALAVERDAGVRRLLAGAQASSRLASPDTDNAQKIAAISVLGELADKAAITLLQPFAEADADPALRPAAITALLSLRQQESFYQLIENLYFGISLGSILLLAAVGLAITFGVMGVINMAHGEMMMLGAYTAYVIQLLMPQAINASLLVAVPAAFIVAGLTGILIERLVIQRLYGRPLETLLATFGISLILQQLVRTVFSPLNRPVSTPDWMSGLVEINGMLSLTLNRLYIIAFSLIVFLLLIALLRRTALGLQMRAVTQNRGMASSMGIHTGRVDALTFGLGSGIAGIAGVALSQLTNVGPNLGQAYIIDSFMVVVFGGVGNLFGTFLSSMILGVANKFLEPVAGAVLAKILILVFIILFIQRRPRGLFALKGRFVED